MLMRYFVSLRIGRRPRRDAHRRYVSAELGKNTSPKAAHTDDRRPRAQEQFHTRACRLDNSLRRVEKRAAAEFGLPQRPELASHGCLGS